MTAFLFGCAHTGTTKGLVNLNDEVYGEGVQGMTGLVLMAADWCTACKVFKPAWDEIAEEYKDKLSFRYVNVDESQELAKRIQFIPTMIVYVNGIPVFYENALSVDDLRILCDTILEKKANLDANGF